MGYCGEYGIACDNANEIGYCRLTACTRHVSQTWMTTDDEGRLHFNYNVKVTNKCEICGRDTEDGYYHLCPKCRLKLHDLIYGDDNWGKGNYWA